MAQRGAGRAQARRDAPRRQNAQGFPAQRPYAPRHRIYEAKRAARRRRTQKWAVPQQLRPPPRVRTDGAGQGRGLSRTGAGPPPHAHPQTRVPSAGRRLLRPAPPFIRPLPASTSRVIAGAARRLEKGTGNRGHTEGFRGKGDPSDRSQTPGGIQPVFVSAPPLPAADRYFAFLAYKLDCQAPRCGSAVEHSPRMPRLWLDSQ